ncbi:hypothetical protein AB0C02_13090 [Micromonospora sp. NPDC048999]|uniref:hypothetical protein n=1 Tax=Micromonospora sp. NPDC048999 TaxID=3155391 RepID=UPI00340AA662
MSDLSAVRNDIRATQRMLANLQGAIDGVGSQVDVIGREQQATQDQLLTLRAEFARFVQQAERTANIQRAETAINTLKNDIEHQFGHHKVVRRTAVGMLRSFDLGLVTEETVRAVGEQLMLQTPRYWLAPVLVALAAWAGDDPDLCVRAVEEAYHRSPHRTSLLMTLVLRRQGRRSSAVRWLRHYLDAQDPAALSREFAVILESIAQGAFGPAGVELVRERLETWRDRLLADEAVTIAQVNRWRREMETHVRADGVADDFPRLAAASPQWPQLQHALACADAHQSIIDRYTALMNAEAPPSSRIEDAIDDILDRLVGDYDHEELPLRRKLAANEAIVQCDGDLEQAARAAHSEATGLEDTRDYLTIQTESALHPDAIGVSTQTQRLAVAFCHDWMSHSHAAFTRDYRLEVPDTVKVTFALRSTYGKIGFRPPQWTGSFTTPMDALERSLEAHWDRHAQSFLDSLTFDWGKRLIGPAVVAVLVLLVVSGMSNVGLGLLAAAAVAGVWALALKGQAEKAAAEQEKARAAIAKARTESLVALRATGAELTDWTSRFTAADGKEPQVKALLTDLATAGAPGARHERRMVGRIEEE